jgi:hypothetical protein
MAILYCNAGNTDDIRSSISCAKTKGYLKVADLEASLKYERKTSRRKTVIEMFEKEIKRLQR